jgi:Tol biopolymer transport system component
MVPVKAVLPVRAAPAVPPSLVTLAAYEGLKRDPSFSPDGTNVAFAWHNGPQPGYGIYVKPLNGGDSFTSLTNGNLEDWGPAWSPDGRRIAFRRSGSRTGIFWVPSTGGPATQVASIARQAQYTLPQMSWSHDGKWIAAPDRGEKGGTQLYLFGIESGEKRALTINRTGTDHAPAFSPDGRSLAYASCSDDVFPCDVYVIDLSAGLQPKALRRITDVSLYLRGVAWLPDGKSLVYSAGSKNGDATSLWRVSVDPPGLPERIDMAGDHARHPTISPKGELLAYTRLGNWNLMMIQHFR